jgi:hypothetical protein
MVSVNKTIHRNLPIKVKGQTKNNLNNYSKEKRRDQKAASGLIFLLSAIKSLVAALLTFLWRRAKAYIKRYYPKRSDIH